MLKITFAKSTALQQANWVQDRPVAGL